ncbi:MAG: UPF0147 family protein [Candidatus Diapherotrites archaeon]|nr:UPF0147 family protein [Candidatus Diapherotrites archaeon]
MRKKKINEEALKQIIEMMDEVINDFSVPKNIRATIEDAKNKIKDIKSFDVNASAAIYALQDITNDINMPVHTRTEIWTIISSLEALKEKNK